MTATKKRKKAYAIGQFLYKYYGLSLREVFGKSRETLLAELEEVPCNLCGADDPITVAHTDKYNLPVRTVICKQCGLIYLNPRPTLSSYSNFYEGGGTASSSYHRTIDFHSIDDLLKEYFGGEYEVKHTPRDIEDFERQSEATEKAGPHEAESPDKTTTFNRYGLEILDYLSSDIPKGSKIFEVGASHGQLLLPWRELHDCEVSGVEPKKKTVEVALESNGIKLFQGFSDNPDIPRNYYDLVTNIRTINHMLDPMTELKNAHEWIKDDGYIFIDIQDSISKSRSKGFTANVVEIDHPYMFSIATLSAFVEKAGFKIIRAEHADVNRAQSNREDYEPWQIRILARKVDGDVKVTYPDPFDELARLMRSCQQYGVNLDRKNKQLTKRTRQLKNAIKNVKSRYAQQKDGNKSGLNSDATQPTVG
ncbi:class I SAM-dependent methyltransferase [Thiohalobacter sp. IOR34]|uniref:class I SAM-dependent methyltransferase n=1 Tax=Thiohalobacter sp. IOR34 TaxID=3057176 RepID=UPI0025B0AE55|nr:class I SAM-dependent methyltransferase [Thiohalobacter sp. IOR34]WJW75952.1 class I SAM-dependent methyltransferase [Thiohalobacter sp. IOR34]